MDFTRRSRTATRATLLASTAIIALLSACSATPPSSSENQPQIAGAYFMW